MTALDIITSALRLLGAIAQGEAASSEDAMDGMLALNMMLDNWAARRLLTPSLTTESFPIGPNPKASYAIGPGAADFNTTKPEEVIDAYVRDVSGFDYPLDAMTLEEYDSLPDKSTLAGLPLRFRYDPVGPQSPIGLVYLYPLAGLPYTLFIDSLKPFSEFVSLTDTVEFPAAYARAMKYNLAMDLAPEYGVALAPEAIAAARESLRTIRNLNSVVEKASYEFVRTRRFDINAGW